ncbi:hypothetical protein LOD99_14382 [Oopsacas minuta]|uniref:Ubiquitin carboxyl-terminal hydrolase CYLD n=1 Tax=Oopsacas minuta TaxID=111878 RepID=A0AAV7KJC3_9METZ|nr:hypothetical protein LOD99_14382 [Oopsacas minuta]
MDLHSFLSQAGVDGLEFYMISKIVKLNLIIEWQYFPSRHEESYFAHFKDWLYSENSVDEKFKVERGEILATSTTFTNPAEYKSNKKTYILIDYFLRRKGKSLPLIKDFDYPSESMKCIDKPKLGTLLAFCDYEKRYMYYVDRYPFVLQYLDLDIGWKVNIIDPETNKNCSGEIVEKKYVEFQLCYSLQPDSLASDTIQFGITDFHSLIMDKTRTSNNFVQKQQEQINSRIKKAQHKTLQIQPGTQSDSTYEQIPKSAPVQTNHQIPFQDKGDPPINNHLKQGTSTGYTTDSNSPSQLQDPGADSVPLNETHSLPNNYGIRECNNVTVRLMEKVHEGRVVWVGMFKNVPEVWTLIETTEPRNEPNTFESHGIKYEKKIAHVKPGHGLFVPAKACTLVVPDDIKCPPELPYSSLTGAPNKFDPYSASVIDTGFIPPIKYVKDIIGIKKGIQGLDNSCYMDASLFGMFCFNEMLDEIFLKKSQESKGDNNERYMVVQKILRERIVYPLRKEGFVRADQILLLRYKLDEAGVVDGLLGKEKDPEEFLTCLLQHVLNVQPYLKIRGTRNENGFFFQIFTHRRPHINLPTVQLLLEHAFREDKLMLAEVPQFFLIQMPRDGKHFRLYPHILPSLSLDISNITQSVYSPNCIHCNKPAFYRCGECETSEIYDYKKVYIYYCEGCVQSHEAQTAHKPEEITCDRKQQGLPSQMTLFAVLTIEIGHYVCFAKCGKNPKDWVMFDSMHDRIEDGIKSRNIPRVMPVPDLEDWLSDPNKLCKVSDLDARTTVPEYIRRLTRDVYICMYYSEANQIF